MNNKKIKLVSVRFDLADDETYDYISNDEADVGDIVEVNNRGKKIPLEVECVKYYSRKSTPLYLKDYKFAKLVK